MQSLHGSVVVRFLLLCMVGAFFSEARADSAKDMATRIAAAQHHINTGGLDTAYFELSAVITDIQRYYANQPEHLEQQSKASLLIGNIYLQMVQYDSAIAYYEVALRIGKQLGKHALMREAHTMLGDVYAVQHQFDRALFHLKTAKDMPLDAGEVLIQSGIMSNIGTVYYQKKDYANALRYYREGLSIAHRHQHTQGIAWCEDDLGLVYFKQRMYDSALVHYQQSLAACAATQQVFFSANVLSNIGNLYLQMGDARRALTALKDAQMRIEPSLAPELYHEIASRLAIAYSWLSDYRHAYEAEQAAIRSDSIVRENMTRQRTKLLALQPEIAQRQAAMLKLEISQKTLRLRVLIGAVIAALVVLLAAFFLYRKQQEARVLRIERDIATHKAHEEEVQRQAEVSKNERLISLVGEMQQGINTLNESLIDKHRLTASLYELTQELTRAERKHSSAHAWQQTLASMEDAIRKPIAEQVLTPAFAQIDAQLTQYLHAHPEISLGKREIRLAAYLLMGYNTREISEMSGIAQRSVEQARYRLRQKLGVPESSSLKAVLETWIDAPPAANA
jgi:tetratricopeptide (TPR) repeat protein/DNA-binding CsgD family transcriptional regulator